MTGPRSSDRSARCTGRKVVGPIPRPRPECDLYIPGHTVHWIQARLAWEHPREWAVLEAVQGRVITVRFSDRMARYRNHDPEALLDIAGHGSSVLVSERYGTLSAPTGRGTFGCFCIADADEPWRACSVAPMGPVSHQDLVDRLEDRGGFSIPGALLPSIDAGLDGVGDGA
jgi:hypothetical protein